MTVDEQEPEVLIRVEGRAGRITMNRPKALNALTLGMVRQIWTALKTWEKDAAVHLILLDGTGDRALCAGGDVRSLYDSRVEGSETARTFWREEYRLDALIHRYPKPFVAIQHGVVMGGGIGISAHAHYRVVTERSLLAMPETGIGLIPDVGGTWLLARAPGELGPYLGLTGTRMSGSDAIQMGFAGTFVPASALPALKDRLCETDGDPVDVIFEGLAEEFPVPQSPLMDLKPEIDRAFAGETVEAIHAALLASTQDWAKAARAELTQKSPLALKTALHAIRQARRLATLEDAMKVEFRLCTRLFESGEFIEGVRALIVDKDRTPAWKPARIEDVEMAEVYALFVPLPTADELVLPPSGR